MNKKVKKYLNEQISEDEYTLKADVVLRTIEEDNQLQQAILNGDQYVFDEIMRHMAKNPRNWGAHIKRHIFNMAFAGQMQIEELTPETVEAFIYEAFDDNDMKNRGSIHPNTATTLRSQLSKWMNSPVEKISRDTCFLFAFGLNMNDIDVSYLLQNVLRQADFNARDYEEAIYYYCLYNNLKYTGVKKWLSRYEAIKLEKEKDTQNEVIDTYTLVETLHEIAENGSEDAFYQYLADLKKSSNEERKSITCKNVMKSKLSELLHCLYWEKNEKLDQAMENGYANRYTLNDQQDANPEMLLYYMRSNDTSYVKVPQALDRLVKKGIIHFPAWTEKSLEKMIYERTTQVHREDLLMATFLAEVCDKGKEFQEDEDCKDKSIYMKRKAWFVSEANTVLEECGFCEIYLLNPFDLFLISCLLQENPMEYYLAAWKKYRNKELEKRMKQKKKKRVANKKNEKKNDR